MKTKCKYCGKEIDRSPSLIKRSKNVFCDHLCYGKWLKGKKSILNHRIKIPCANCGNVLEKANWEINKRENHFCNNKCRGEWRSENLKGKNNESWKGGPEFYKERKWYIDQHKNSKKWRSLPQNKLAHRMSTAVYGALKENKNGRRWEKLLNYTCKDLKKHLQNLFVDGMNWENMGEWHIDHIIPKSTFNYLYPEDEDFKKCWALKNLQPLWAIDNMKKHTSLNWSKI